MRLNQIHFKYSDGDEVEERLLEILKRATDLRSNSRELSAAITDWPSRVHLSPERRNLLFPVQMLLQGHVLELGAGFGAITRYLGETAPFVTALEGSPRRAEGARMRCRGLPNVEIVQAEFLEWAPANRFAAILAIGFLEYAAYGASGPDPYLASLRHMREMVEPDGALVLAIENVLGLRYLAGAPEPHLGIPFFGVNDFYASRTPRTFGRKQLETLLREAGFEDLVWMYPLPDYHFPAVIVHSEACTVPDFDLGSILENTLSTATPLKVCPAFVPGRALSVAWRNGVLEDVADSFLVIARPQAQALAGSAKPIVVAFSTGRLPEFQKAVIFEKNGEEIQVRAEKLQPEFSPATNSYVHLLADGAYIHGRLYSGALWGVVGEKGWDLAALWKWLAPWVDYLKYHAVECSGRMLLPAEMLDCTPFNLVETSGGTLCAFDLEYAPVGRLPLEYIVFRGMWQCFCRLQGCAEPAATVPRLCLAAVQAVMREGGLEISGEQVYEYVKREVDMQHQIAAVPPVDAFTIFGTQQLPVIGDRPVQDHTHFSCKAYWRTAGEPYSEDASVEALGRVLPGLQHVTLAIPPTSGLSALRLDPTDQPMLLYVQSIALTDLIGRELKRWTPADVAAGRRGATAVIPDVGHSDGFFLVSSSIDPQIHFDIDAATAAGCLEGALLNLFYSAPYGTNATEAMLREAAREFGLQRITEQLGELRTEVEGRSGTLGRQIETVSGEVQQSGLMLQQLRIATDELTRNAALLTKAQSTWLGRLLFGREQ